MDAGVEQITADLAKVVCGEVYGDILHRAAFSSDASIYRIVPACVVAPRDINDIVTVVRYAGTCGIPVAARGAASGTAGESLCAGIVFDMTRYMKRIIGVGDEGTTVICEPGVVLNELNEYLAGYGRKIGPDPSSGNRATIGGCVANNSTGAHSLQYGYMADYVVSVQAVMVDGSVVEFRNDIDPESEPDRKLASLAAESLSLLSENQAVIEKALPKASRNRSGYNIAGVCHDGRIDLAKMLVGSEGTFGIFTRIVLRTVDVPPAIGLLQLEFDSLAKMAQAVPIIVDSGASACELMDQRLIRLAFDALPQYRDILPANAAAVLLVEHVGENDTEVREKLEMTDFAVGSIADGRRIVLDQAEQKRLWKSRNDAGPLLFRKKGKKHPAEFMEDVSVPHDRLGEYIAGLERISKKYEIVMSYYGHAGDGELHLRPYLDLSEPAEVEKMRAMANDVFSLAWSLGGSISGEHADGLVRAAFVRRQYGDEYYRLLRDLKKIFDPVNLMNPGKIINDNPDAMTTNLRAQRKYIAERLRSQLNIAKDELAAELAQCGGCGVCLSRQTDLRMCPVYRALGEELGSSRAKANILALWATGDISDEQFESEDFRKFLDLCINCKACSLECPSGVDVSKLMVAARAEYVRRRRLRRTESALSKNRYLGLLGAAFAPVSNFVTTLPMFRRGLEQLIGLDKRRTMPRFQWGTFLGRGRRYLARHGHLAEPVDKVAYFVDTFANYNDHGLGLAVLKVLLANNIEVILPKQRPAPLPAIVYGDFRTASRDLAFSARYLADAVRGGYKVVCSEPSAALCWQQEARHFVDNEDVALVAADTYELMTYLLDLFRQGKLKAPPKPLSGRYTYHCPCHLFAIGGCSASIELLGNLCGLKVEDIKAGCCGLAGTFGMQKKNYDLSDEISKPLRQALAESPADQVLTECAACAMQIEHISDKKVIHPIKILAQAYEPD